MGSPSELLINKIFNVNPANFEAVTLEVFNFQYQNNVVLRQYCEILKINSAEVTSLEKIPYLPIQLFKTHQIKSTDFKEQQIFESSGTTGSINSKHYIKSTEIYEESFLKSFEIFYGDISQYCILGLLPSYLERGNSSLVYMVNKLIRLSRKSESGFYLNEFESLNLMLQKNEASGQKTLLIGVTYALLDFFEAYPMQLTHTIVMETGGMKGRKKEMSRAEVHKTLKKCCGLENIHSEYGMTELLSQAYSDGNGIFKSPPWMKILTRDPEDPFDISNLDSNSEGAANIIDLANIFSCSFIQTDDLARTHSDSSFEILGRLENCDLRGCGLMIID